MCFSLGRMIFNHPAIQKQYELHTMVLFTEPNCWKWLCFCFPSNRLCSVWQCISVVTINIKCAQLRIIPCPTYSSVPWYWWNILDIFLTFFLVVRVTLVVAFWLFALKFWEMMGNTYDGFAPKWMQLDWWGHSVLLAV